MTTPGVLESDSYGVAMKVAQAALRERDPLAAAERCGAVWAPAAGSGSGSQGDLRVRFLGSEFAVAFPEATVWSETGGRSPATVWDAILILHYLGSTGPVPARREPVAFADLPDGKFYDPAFQGRCRVPLLRTFGPRPEALAAVGPALDAVPWDRGDASLAIRAFPRLDVYLVLYRGDDEFPPGGSVLFSSDVRAFLSTEDIAVLGGAVVSRLSRAWKLREGGPPVPNA